MGNPDDITYRLDSGDLARFDLQASTWWAAGWSARGEQLTYPGRHGNAAPAKPAVWDPQPLQLDMLLQEPSQAQLQAVMTELTGLVAQGGPRTLRRVSAGEVTEQPCRVVSFQPGEFVVGRYAQVSVTVELMGPFWRAPSTTDRAVPAGTSTLPRTGTAPVTDAIVRFAGPSSGAHTVTEGVWGTGITWTGSLVSGQHVFIDPRAMRSWLGASGDWTRQWRSLDASTGLAPATAGPLALHHKTGWGAGTVTRTNYAHDPFLEHTPVGSEMSGAGSSVSDAPVAVVDGKKWVALASTYPTPGSGYLDFESSPSSSPWAGKTIHFSATVKVTKEALDGGAFPYLLILRRDEQNGPLRSIRSAQPSVPGTYDLSVSAHVPDFSGQTVYIRAYHNAQVGNPPLYYRNFYLSETPGQAFSGDTPDTDELAYEWTGTPGASPSTVGPRVLVRSTPLTASKTATLRYKEAWL